ncbi:A-kinase anchor protein 9-like protein [Tanacetum coccineum]
MFRAQPNGKSPSSGERIDFKFSNFQALQVPKVWDKLLVSIISVETGKTIARSSKALVRNGTCQWTETLSESIWISHYDSSKELEEHLFKFVVSMGSARSGILGEATVNIARYYTSSRSSAPVSLPLKKCNYGTVLQVKIQCLTPTSKLRVEGSKYSGSNPEEKAADEDYDDAGSRSLGSEASPNLSAKSASSQDMPPTSLLGRIKIMERTYEPSGSNQNNDSAEYSLEKERFFQKSHINGIKQNFNANSKNSSPRSNYLFEEDLSVSKSNNSSFKSRITHDEQEQEYSDSPSPVPPTTSLMNATSSKNLLEAAEDTIEELRDEAKLWERRAQKLMLDLEILKEKFSDQSKCLADSQMELSAAQAERDGMKKEVDHIKMLLKESVVKQKATMESNSTYKSEGQSQLLKELENELKAHKEANVDLNQQLKRNQESNIELVCILQELEEMTETQKAEIEELLVVKSKLTDLEKSFNSNLVETRSLQLKLQQMEESEKTSQANMQILEQALENKISDLEHERTSNSQTLLVLEKEYKDALSIKEEDINNLEFKLSSCIKEQKEIEEDQMREIQELRSKVSEVEKECSELTNENLELLCEIKESKKVAQERNVTIEEDQKLLEDYNLKIKELESLKAEQEAQIADLEKEKGELQENIEIALNESNITSKCLDNLRNDLMVLSSSVDSQVSANKLLERKAKELEKVKGEMELRLFEMEEENIKLTECVNDLENQLSRVRDDHESTLLELQKSESENADLQKEVENLKNVEKLLLDAQEECEYVKTEKQKLQESAENLIEECNALQKSYEDMTKGKADLYDQCSRLEIELMEARENVVSYSERVADLEEKYSSMLEEYTFKEKSLSSHLDELNQENWKLKEKVTLEESLLNQMYLEKTAEIENFQKEVEYLKEEISRVHEQRSKLTSEKSKLESSLKEVNSRTESIEKELQTVREESELNIQNLTTELATIKQNHKKLTVDYEKKSKLLNGYRTREERRKTMENDLELKLTVSEYERQQLIQEAASLKDKMHKTLNLENEVFDYKRKLDKLKGEKSNLEASLRLVSSSNEELQAEKISFAKKMSEYENCKNEKSALEEKLIRLESDITAKNTSRSNDADIKNEISRIKSANLKHQLKIQQLEGEKNECLKKMEDLKLQLAKSKTGANETRSQEDIDYAAKIEMLEAELDEALDANKKYRLQLQRLKPEGRNSLSSAPGKSKAENEAVTKDRFERTKSSLETELKDLRDRYLEMSLKYAEVEAEREDLVMQLKTNSTRKRFQILDNP